MSAQGQFNFNSTVVPSLVPPDPPPFPPSLVEGSSQPSRPSRVRFDPAVTYHGSLTSHSERLSSHSICFDASLRKKKKPLRIKPPNFHSINPFAVLYRDETEDDNPCDLNHVSSLPDDPLVNDRYGKTCVDPLTISAPPAPSNQSHPNGTASTITVPSTSILTLADAPPAPSVEPLASACCGDTIDHPKADASSKLSSACDQFLLDGPGLIQEFDKPITIAFTDGGFIPSSNLMSGGFLWTDLTGSSKDMAASELTHPVPSNNVAEILAALNCLENTLSSGVTSLHLFMDSELIVSWITGVARCSNIHLSPLLSDLMILIAQFEYFVVSHVLRHHNKAADHLCNMVFETDMQLVNSFSFPDFWDIYLRSCITFATVQPRPSLVSWQTHRWTEAFNFVLAELALCGPMIRNHIPSLVPLHQIFSPIGSFEPESVDTGLAPSPCTHIHFGPTFPYILNPTPYASMRALAKELGVAWDPNCFRRRLDGVTFPPPPSFSLPLEDKDLVMRLLRACNMDLTRVIKAWRAQTPSDPRPNKVFDSSRVKSYLSRQGSSLPLDDFDEICRNGLSIPWKHDKFTAARPLPPNHPSATDNAAMVISKIMTQYNLGRLLPVDATELAASCPSFAVSPYGLVEKNNVPLTENGRPIHNQSFPSGTSVNDQIDQSRTLDAFWPGPPMTADRAISQARIHGSENLFSFSTDIKDAFNTVHLNASDAPVNGSIVPNTDLGLISLVCTFGNGCSPGGFKAINIVGPLHRLGSSVINNNSVIFDCQFYCDDGNLIEPNIGSRLHDAESWIRMLIDSVFGPDGINEGKQEFGCLTSDSLASFGIYAAAPSPCPKTNSHALNKK